MKSLKKSYQLIQLINEIDNRIVNFLKHQFNVVEDYPQQISKLDYGVCTIFFVISILDACLVNFD